jgi:Tol biopolymer transport system component
MAISESSPVCARFDRFEINLLSGDLQTSEGSSTRIQPLPLQVLRLLLEAEGGVVITEKFLSSTAIESGPQFSPDGSQIVFESTRSGAYEVWLCRSDGTNPLQLTHFNTVTGTPRWSPDGTQIAFDSRTPGNADIFVMDSRGGSLRKLTNEPSAEVVPSWSRDGRWIYFASERSGGWEIWKMPSAGGPAVQRSFTRNWTPLAETLCWWRTSGSRCRR